MTDGDFRRTKGSRRAPRSRRGSASVAPEAVNNQRVIPLPETHVDGFHLQLPVFYDTVQTLRQTVEVDYSLPGCPPEAPRIWNAIVAILENKLPPPGSVIGAETPCCDECPRKRNEKKIKQFKRTWEIIPASRRWLKNSAWSAFLTPR